MFGLRVAEQLDRLAITELIARERLARDNGFFDEMESCYHPDSIVDISWFRGSGAEFVASSRKNYKSIDVSIHLLSPSVVTLNGDRALAETPCVNRSFFEVDGVELTREGFTRLLWRMQRLDGQWLIAGLRVFYIRDLLVACNPMRPPKLDEAKLATYRRSFRYLNQTLSTVGIAPLAEVPGTDMPETVVALREGERLWLRQGD